MKKGKLNLGLLVVGLIFTGVLIAQPPTQVNQTTINTALNQGGTMGITIMQWAKWSIVALMGLYTMNAFMADKPSKNTALLTFAIVLVISIALTLLFGI